MTETIGKSQNGVPIRLPEERWQHIITRHGGLNDKKEFLLETIAHSINRCL